MPDILLDGWLDCFHAGTRDCRSASVTKASKKEVQQSFLLAFWHAFRLAGKPFAAKLSLRRSGEVSVSFFQCGFHDARADELSQSDG